MRSCRTAAYGPHSQAGKVLRMNTQRLTQITVGIIAIAILAVIVVNRINTGGPVELDLSNQPVLGNPNAAVQVVMFEDFLCPACATFTESIFPQVKSQHENNDDVAFWYVNFPVIPGSDGAATVAECVYQQSNEQFWELYPIFMRSQGQIRTRAAALELASEYTVGIDREQLAACAEDPATLAAVTADGAMATASGATGTPTIFVNGRIVTTSAAAINNAIAAALP